MKKWCLPLLILFIVSGCNQSLPKQMPDDFAFSLKYGVMLANELNIYEHTFTKDLVADGKAETEMILTDEEFSQIYDLFREVDVFKVSKGSGPPCMEPYEKYELKMTMNEQDYDLSWNTSCHFQKQLKWETVLNEIRINIIQTKPEYQQLPEANGGYE
ncbi:hypothetical protein MKY91_05895 [Alkalicoccobacillus gibsonii]|uniref:Lipoprotein n=1 Tax=Alkalicoccobacillus gibsonii TaxID=79881 RepID=A0ABU9VGE0_9BACI